MKIEMRPDGWPCRCCGPGCAFCGDTDCRSPRHADMAKEPACGGRGLVPCDGCDEGTARVLVDDLHKLCVDCSLDLDTSGVPVIAIPGEERTTAGVGDSRAREAFDETSWMSKLMREVA